MSRTVKVGEEMGKEEEKAGTHRVNIVLCFGRTGRKQVSWRGRHNVDNTFRFVFFSYDDKRIFRFVEDDSLNTNQRRVFAFLN